MSTLLNRSRIGLQLFLALVIMAALFVAPASRAQASTIPTFAIKAVDIGNSVTIKTANFPAHKTFTVRIGAYGTLGIGGKVVATTDSGTGGTFTITYNIPADLKTSTRLAIRMDSPEGFFSYNWFWNNTPPVVTPGFSGIPTFAITAVTAGTNVTIKTNNFPANKDFTVRIGKFGTLGVGGEVVATTNSGTGGTFTVTYNIPTDLKDATRLAIRMDASGGFFAYNWFWNTVPAVPPTPVPGFSGIPTFVISAVVKDTSVTIKTNNFPANKDFTVRIGAYGTLGIGGTVVATTNSGTGGTFTVTYNIPTALKGATRLAIRMDASGGFFAYNWFWNN